MPEHEPHGGLLPLRLERLPGEHNSLDNDSIRVDGKHAVVAFNSKQTQQQKQEQQQRLLRHLPVATRERAPLGISLNARTGDGGKTIGQ
jgi:hypothetical protein